MVHVHSCDVYVCRERKREREQKVNGILERSYELLRKTKFKRNKERLMHRYANRGCIRVSKAAGMLKCILGSYYLRKKKK